MQFNDAITIDGARLTADGYLVATAKVARTGIQTYQGSELGRPDLDTVRVFRDEKEVFAGDAMASFAFKPVSIDHPSRMVSADSWRDHAVGFTAGDIARDGDFLRVPLMLADRDAIQHVQDGTRQLSAGYTCDILFEPGTTPDGQDYQARQIAIRANHIAVVPNGRAGPECRIGDAVNSPVFQSTEKGRIEMADIQLRTVLHDGLEIQTTSQGAQAIEKLQRQLSDSAEALKAKDVSLAALRDAQAEVLGKKDGEVAVIRDEQAKAVSTKDGEMDALRSAHRTELEAKDGEIAALKAQIPDAAAMDALIAERETVIRAAKKLLGDSFDPKGQSAADIKRRAVSSRLGDEQTKSRDDSYIAAAFDTLSAIGAAAPTRDPMRDAIANAPAQSTPVADSRAAREDMVKRLQTAWQNPVKGAA